MWRINYLHRPNYEAEERKEVILRLLLVLRSKYEAELSLTTIFKLSNRLKRRTGGREGDRAFE